MPNPVNPPPDKPQPVRKGSWAQAGKLSTLGLEIFVSIMLGFLGGRWLDIRLGTEPWLLIFGAAAGLGAAIKAVIRIFHIARHTASTIEKHD